MKDNSEDIGFEFNDEPKIAIVENNASEFLSNNISL